MKTRWKLTLWAPTGTGTYQFNSTWLNNTLPNINFIRSTRFPLFNLQIVLEVLSGSILKDLCDFTREEKYSLLGICYNMTLDIKAFKLLPELQRVMEALYISLDAHRQLVIVRINRVLIRGGRLTVSYGRRILFIALKSTIMITRH